MKVLKLLVAFTLAIIWLPSLVSAEETMTNGMKEIATSQPAMKLAQSMRQRTGVRTPSPQSIRSIRMPDGSRATTIVTRSGTLEATCQSGGGKPCTCAEVCVASATDCKCFTSAEVPNVP
jgi:hypothetical protein